MLISAILLYIIMSIYPLCIKRVQIQFIMVAQHEEDLKGKKERSMNSLYCKAKFTNIIKHRPTKQGIVMTVDSFKLNTISF